VYILLMSMKGEVNVVFPEFQILGIGSRVEWSLSNISSFRLRPTQPTGYDLNYFVPWTLMEPG
jgi:hypothetical protein